MRENSVVCHYPPDYGGHFTQVPCPLYIPQHIKLLSEPARTMPERPTLPYRWARAQVITKTLSSWSLRRGFQPARKAARVGKARVLLAQSAGDGQQVSLEGCELGGYDGRFCIWRCILPLPGGKTGIAGERQDRWSGRHHLRVLPLVLRVTRVTLNATPLRFSTHGSRGDILKGSFYSFFYQIII